MPRRVRFEGNDEARTITLDVEASDTIDSVLRAEGVPPESIRRIWEQLKAGRKPDTRRI